MSSKPDGKFEKAAKEPSGPHQSSNRSEASVVSARPPSRNILPEVITSNNVAVSPPLPPDQVAALHDESGKGKSTAREGGKSELSLCVPTHEEEDKETVPIPAAQMAANLEARDQDLQKKILKNDGAADRVVSSSAIANRSGNEAPAPPTQIAKNEIEYANSGAPTMSSSTCAVASIHSVATTNTSRSAPETEISSNPTAATVNSENNEYGDSDSGNPGGDGSPETGTPVLEATLVEEQLSAPVYNAVVVPAGRLGNIGNGGNEDTDDRDKVEPAPWWKKHKILISVSVIAIILFGGLMATIGALMTSNNNGSGDNNNNNSDSNPSSNVVDGNDDPPGTGIESTNATSTSMTSSAIDNESVDDSNTLVGNPTQTPFYPPVPTRYPKTNGPDLATQSPTTISPVLAPAPTTVPDMELETESPTTPSPSTFRFPTLKPLLETPAPMTRPSPFGFPTTGPDLELDTSAPTTRAPMTRPSPFGFPTTGPDLELDTSSPTTRAPMTRPSPFGFPTTGPDLELDTSSPTTRAPSSAIAETCTPYTATFEKSMFDTSCAGNCTYGDVMLAVDGEVAAVSRKNEQLVFYENTLSFGQGSNAGPGFVLTESTTLEPLASKATSMAIYGDSAVVGFAEEDVAFVYERNSATGEWSKSTELSASFNTTTRANTRHRYARMRANRNLTMANNRLMQGNSSVSDSNTNAMKLIRFGHSVDIRRDLIVVGAIDDGDNSEGRVYVYRRVDGEWVRDGRLGNLASGSRSEDFGSSVSLNGIVIVVGDNRYGDTDQGAFYVFHFEGLSWLQMQSAFVSTDCDGRFASHVELLDQYQLFVSCPNENNASGALHYYTRSTMWTQSSNIFTRKQTLVASDLRASEQFGEHSSSYGTTAVIGTWQSENGRVMVFALENGAWEEKTVIKAPTGFERGFGHRVAYDGNTMLIASYGNVASYSLECIV